MRTAKGNGNGSVKYNQQSHNRINYSIYASFTSRQQCYQCTAPSRLPENKIRPFVCASETSNTTNCSPTMVRRSFSSSFLRVFLRRRSKEGGDDDTSNRRKESLDQTVLSGDDSRFNRSVVSVDDLQVKVAAAVAPAPAALTRASKSDPTLSLTPPPENCPCYDCIASRDLFLVQGRNALSNNYTGGPAPPFPTQQYAPSTVANANNGQDFCQQPSSFDQDPTLKARMEAVEIQQRMLGDNHPDVIFALQSLAKMCQKRGYFEVATSITRESQVRSMRAKTSAYEQQINRNQQQDLEQRGGVLVPSEISFSYGSSFGR